MEKKQPNIVIVLADDVTPAYHSCYGGRTPTPAIDALAKNGIRFDRSCGVAPLCNPSRWTIFTGTYTGRAASASAGATTTEPYEINQNADLQPETPTLAKLLRQQGYFTGHVGKWHSNFSYAGPNEWDSNLLGPDCDLDDPAVDRRLRDLQETHRKTIRDCGGFEWVGAANWGNLSPTRKPQPLSHHNPAWMTDRALDFLDEASRSGRPFYLHLANTVPHGPHPDKSLGKDHAYTFEGKWEHAPQSHPDDNTIHNRLQERGILPGTLPADTYGINAGTVQIDDQIAALTERLRALGELENTLFLYTADHGIIGKGTCYRGGWHMPCVLQWPAAIPGGQTIDHLISHVDFLPTFCEAAGVTIPANVPCDGVSHLRALREPGRHPWSRTVAYQEMGVCRSIVTGRWHYLTWRLPESAIAHLQKNPHLEARDIFAHRDRSLFCDYNFRWKPAYFDPEQLYDLEADPYERTNLAGDARYADTLKSLRAELFNITDTLPGPYRHDIPMFMSEPLWLHMVQAKRERVWRERTYPEGFDKERWTNDNLPVWS